MGARITIRRPDEAELQRLGIEHWPIWSKGPSIFPWSYDTRETSYIVEGRVIVTPDGGEPLEIGVGDLASFPAGLSCTWDIREPLRKHYHID
ncbi:MAG: cupin domain-containing protein [Pseudomonadota bacterium]